MSHAKDPAIKLFGKTIITGLPARASSSSSSSSSSPPHDSTGSSVNYTDPDRLSHSSTGANHSDKDGAVTILNSSCSSVMQNMKLPSDGCPQEEMDQAENPHGKRPDKLLPCPRCKSMETKFCYYNNYNVNQPRHFCKNCQRYWTAGGTMRNVPIGAGRRKNKVSSSPFRAPDSSHSNLGHTPNAIPHPSLLADNTILKFGSSSSANSSIHESEICDQAGMHPWQCPPDLRRSGYPMQCYPTFWGCAVPPFWTLSWFPHPSSQLISTSSPKSPTLGKHPRGTDEDEPGREQNVGNVLWVPKTLRIGDPKEAARHCIWPSLGINSERTSFAGDGKLFRTYSKGEDRNHRSDASPWVSLRSAT